jgi:hypothetical protein
LHRPGKAAKQIVNITENLRFAVVASEKVYGHSLILVNENRKKAGKIIPALALCREEL